LHSPIGYSELDKLLNKYWDVEVHANSWWIFEEIMKNSKQKITITKRRLMAKGIAKIISYKPKFHSEVIKRVDELLKGDDL
jgi:uncharacterized ferritin-like protein (DUF455 family)